MAEDEANSRYATYAEMDLEKAKEFRDDAAVLHQEAEQLPGQAEGEKLETQADDLDRRAWLLEDAAGLWHEATEDERRAAETRTRAGAAYETVLDLRQRERGPMTDDEITELRVEAGRAAGEEAALKERAQTLAHEAGFDVKLAEAEEAAAHAGIVHPEPPTGPENQPNPDLMRPE